MNYLVVVAHPDDEVSFMHVTAQELHVCKG